MTAPMAASCAQALARRFEHAEILDVVNSLVCYLFASMYICAIWMYVYEGGRLSMIDNKVSMLLGARRASIRDLSREAGIAYGTAHALYHGMTTRVEFDVLSRLCHYFDASVCDILVYVPDEATTAGSV